MQRKYYNHTLIPGKFIPVNLFSSLRKAPIFGVLFDMYTVRCMFSLLDDGLFLRNMDIFNMCGILRAVDPPGFVCDINQTTITMIVSRYSGFLIRKSRRSKQFKQIMDLLLQGIADGRRMCCDMSLLIHNLKVAGYK